MNTLKLKQMIEELISKSEYSNELMKELSLVYHFNNKLSIPGVYIYVQDGVYNIVSVGDRGKQEKTIANDLKEVIHDVIWNISSLLSMKIAKQMPRESFRKTMFEIRIKIMASIGIEFKEDGEKRISEILENNPL